MYFSRTWWVRFAICLFVSTLIAAQDTIVIGRTISRVGGTAGFATEATKGFAAFQKVIGSQLQVGTKLYNVSFIEYNDASDTELIGILYDRLIHVDHANFLFSPMMGRLTSLDRAESNQIPMMNAGIYDIFLQGTVKNWTWITTTLSTITSLARPCGDPLAAAGAKTIGVAVAKGLSSAASLVVGNFTSVGSIDAVPDSVFLSDDDLDTLVKKWKALNPDIFTSAGTPAQMVALLQRMRHNRYAPKATHIVTGAGTDEFARQAGWLASDVFFTSDFEASLNYSDALFGSSLKYQDLLVEMFNVTSSISDAYFAQAGTVLIESIRAAGTIDPTEVMKKLRSYNGTTIAGPTSFDPNTGVLQRPYFCFQFSNDGRSKHAVNPSWLPNYSQLVYPAVPVPYPKGFFPKDKKLLVKILVPALVGGLLLLALIGLAIYLVIRHKYHLVFVPKRTNPAEEWS